VACPVGLVADRGTNTCVPCSLDLTVDLATFQNCGNRSFVIPPAPSGPDSCPDQTWVEVINLDTIGACLGLSIEVGVPGQEGLDEENCALHSTSVGAFDPAFQTLFAGGGVGALSTLPPETCTFPPTPSILTQVINGGLHTVRLQVSAEKDEGFTPVKLPVVLSLAEVADVQ